MKKETIFKHELNESIQANAAMNCLKNRNKPQQMNETSEFDARFEFRKDLRELASPVAKKAYMIIRKQYGDSMWRQLGMDDCDEQGLIDMLNMYAEDGLNPQQIVNKMMGVREDEETVDYAQLADDVCASYRGPLSKLDLKDSINYIIKMVAKKIGKTIDTLTPQELTAIQKAAKHSVWYVSEQEEDGINKGGMHNSVQVGHIMNTTSMNDGLDTEYFSDLEEQEAYYENFRAIAELVADQIDRENGKDIANNMDTLFAIVREVWNNNPDDLYIWDFDDVQEDACYKFFDKYYETIKNEYLKREHNNIMAATHDDLFASY